MTTRADLGHRDLPRSDNVPHPARGLLERGRPVVTAMIKRYYDLTQYGTENVPTSGPVVMVGNHVSFIDGPLMAIVGPRPVHALTKIEMFHGPLGGFLRASGQIPVRRHQADITAIRTSLRVLRDGGAVGVFPEGTRGGGEVRSVEPGAAYLSIATGAVVCPVIFLGTRETGSSLHSIAPRRARIAITYGSPVRLESHGWPRRRDEVLDATHRIRNALLETLRSAHAVTGMRLPGPAPDGEVDR